MDFSAAASSLKNPPEIGGTTASSSVSSSFNVSKPSTLLESFKRYAPDRNKFLQQEGKAQLEYPLSNTGWLSSIFTIRGRALDRIAAPWLVVMAHCVLYTVLQETIFADRIQRRNLDYWSLFFGLIINSTLSFMLVFRQNRAASRFWLARELWGKLVAYTRSLVGGALVHGDHNIPVRDEVIRWMAAYAVCTMELMRGKCKNGKVDVPPESLAGVLTREEVLLVSNNPHPPLYVADHVRFYLHELFMVDESTPAGLAYKLTAKKEALEQILDEATLCCGGMERIKSTPLPMVYVSHLRTFLLAALLMFPYVWGPHWRWGTIPVIGTAAFALLGIEGTASEVEVPFYQGRVNALNMDGFCKIIFSNIQQQLQNQQDRIAAVKAAGYTV